MSAEEISAAAQDARRRLQEEIDRVRLGVEEMLDEEQGGEAVDPTGRSHAALRAELDELRLETRNYVKRRVRKSEKKLQSSVTEVSSRSDLIEERLDRVEANRAAAETQIDELEADQVVAESRIDAAEARIHEAEARIEEVETERAEAEARIHEGTEKMLDDLLDEVRSVADRLSQMPAPKPAASPRRRPVPQAAPVGRVGPQHAAARRAV